MDFPGFDAIVQADDTVLGSTLAARASGGGAAREGRRATSRSARRSTRRPRSSTAAASSAGRVYVSVLSPEERVSDIHDAQPPAGRRHPAGLLRPGLHLRGARVALAAAPDRELPARGAAAGRRRLHRHGADHGPRRVRRAGRGVQQDEPPARDAAGRARAGARAPAGGDAPHRRRRSPRTSTAQRAAGHRRQDRRGRRAAPTPAAPRCASRPTSRSRRSRRRAAWTASSGRCGPPSTRSCSGASRVELDRSTTSRALAHPAARGGGHRAGVRRRRGRARRAALRHERAGALPLPRRPGRRLDRERRPARDGRAPGRHGRAHRAVQPPALRGEPGGRGRALPALRPAGRARAAGHRRLQARQRHPRPPAGRRRPARGRAGAAGDLARGRPPGPLRRRGAGRRPARDGSRGRGQPRRARAPRHRGSWPCAATSTARCKVTASLGVATLPGAGYDARSLVEAADDALYRAKRMGKNRTESNA